MSDRAEILRRLGAQAEWDVLVIGGGATGLGAAVEAASRGYKTALIERADFAKGTSSRSTKLVHGGVRYLEQMNITLVLDALQERGHMLENAPHIVHNLSFVVPVYDLVGLPYYGFGLKVYELLSGKLSFGASKMLSREKTLAMLKGVKSDGLRGGVLYHDGQFDDSRYAVSLMRTLEGLGGVAINYVEAAGLIERNGRTAGVRARDIESGETFDLRAKVTINATGVFTENILKMDKDNETLLSVSQGSHFVLPRDFLPGDRAMMIPKTSDGRVLFAIPWHRATVVGTTDEAVDHASVEPHMMEKERSFLLDHIGKYLGRRPEREEIRSMWSGLRPLVRKGGGATSKLSRDHTIIVSPTGLVTVTGGKWTTYRRMGEDTINKAAAVAGLKKEPSRTRALHLHGWTREVAPVESERVYGSDLPEIVKFSEEDASLNELLHPRLPYRAREVVWAARHEMARTVEDVLARRTRALFLDSRAAIEAAPKVADILARELGRSEEWKARDLAMFTAVARGYVYEGM
ncbi:glycerol-3-phosphate dehydrogenase/oxidase [Edaphobacter flagellatus]|uniref:glycerol-3-phosphate dehydrogenase/oxidase n=1 Tax=Edaphobacter flagellatus TaxID=1933044 RepID=UPI0021B2914B|nr:glycerol-3-phosphate dehydrogenase/oxidase [Edaphobacter flagellatus]